MSINIKVMATNVLTLLIPLAGAFLSIQVAQAEGMALNASSVQVAFHEDILLTNERQPEYVVTMRESPIRAGGEVWMGMYEPSKDERLQLLALTDKRSWVEMTWPKPTTVLGVQFTGDNNDGWARILVDGKEVWTGNTYGGGKKFCDYVEISGLTYDVHTVRVEAVGRAGGEGGNIHVTVTAFGVGALSIEPSSHNEYALFVPMILD